MMKQIALAICLMLVFFSPDSASGKKILYVNSYHADLMWSAGILRGAAAVFERDPDLQVKYFHMDTKRHPTEAFKRQSALEAKSVIDTWKPDLIIAADDNASKYLIVPYVKPTSLPVVFCGVNWSAEEYGFPTPFITGMIEVQLIRQIIGTLSGFARGNRVGFLKGDDLSARKEADFYEKRFNISLDKRFVTDFDQWKNQYLDCQDTCDMLLIGNAASVKGWNSDEARALVMEQTRIPSGNWDEWMKPLSLITFATVPEEQGQWAASTALRILSGTKPSDIPLVTNEKARRFLNMTLAKKIGVIFPMELIDDARFVEEDTAAQAETRVQ